MFRALALRQRETFYISISISISISLYRFERWPFLSDEVPTLETLHNTIRIGSTPTFLYFDLYIYILDQ